MSQARSLPPWISIPLNLCTPIGLALTLMGWIRPLWGAVPILLGLIYLCWELWPWLISNHWRAAAVVILTALAFESCFWRAALSRDNGLFPYKVLSESQFEDIHDENYIDQEVQLDGKKFRHCHFTNVTLKYNGLTNFSLQDNTFSGRSRLVSDNEAVLGAWSMIYGLGMVKLGSQPLDKGNNPATNIQLPTFDSPNPSIP